MLVRILHSIAGIDSDTLQQCPKTDRIWGLQLGIWLCTAFCLVFLIALNSTSYVPSLQGNPPLQVAVAFLIALTVFLFDRALYQSDWFFHGYFKHDNPVIAAAKLNGAQKMGRVLVRLGISIVLAYSMAVFLELAIFSGSIQEQLERDYRQTNSAALEKLSAYGAGLREEVEKKRDQLAALTKASLSNMPEANETPPAREQDARIVDIDAKRKVLAERERTLGSSIADLEADIQSAETSRIAEERGIRDGRQLDRRDERTYSGASGCRRRCKAFADVRDQKTRERDRKIQELAGVRTELDTLQTDKSELIKEAQKTALMQSANKERRRLQLNSESAQLSATIDALQAAIPSKVDQATIEMKRSASFTPLRDDPLLRLRALETLKSSETVGGVIKNYSWLLKAFIMFLEIVPVLGKLFFAPPSAYAIHVQKKVERHMVRDLPDEGSAPAANTTTKQQEDREAPKEENSSAESGERTAPLRRRRELTVVPRNQ